MPRSKLEALKELVDSGNSAAVFAFMLEFVADEVDRLDGNDDEIADTIRRVEDKFDKFRTEDWAKFKEEYGELRGEIKGKAAMLATVISIIGVILANLGRIAQFLGG